MEQVLVPTGIMNPGQPRMMCVTLKYQIEQILYDIIAPDQAPRPELRGEIATPPRDTLKTSVAPPKQTLAQMKSDWDAARDHSIGELAPTELGGAYALSMTGSHFGMSIDTRTRRYSKLVPCSGAASMGSKHGQSTPTQPGRSKPRNGTSLPQNLGLLQKAYEQAWVWRREPRPTASKTHCF